MTLQTFFSKAIAQAITKEQEVVGGKVYVGENLNACALIPDAMIGVNDISIVDSDIFTFTQQPLYALWGLKVMGEKCLHRA